MPKWQIHNPRRYSSEFFVGSARVVGGNGRWYRRGGGGGVLAECTESGGDAVADATRVW